MSLEVHNNCIFCKEFTFVVFFIKNNVRHTCGNYYFNTHVIFNLGNCRVTDSFQFADINFYLFHSQVLHKISEVLEPVLFLQTRPETPFYNPNAAEFLNQSEYVNLGDHRIR